MRCLCCSKPCAIDSAVCLLARSSLAEAEFLSGYVRNMRCECTGTPRYSLGGELAHGGAAANR